MAPKLLKWIADLEEGEKVIISVGLTLWRWWSRVASKRGGGTRLLELQGGFVWLRRQKGRSREGVDLLTPFSTNKMGWAW